MRPITPALAAALVVCSLIPTPTFADTPVWIPSGVAICTASWDQRSIDLVPDGAGGAIVVWVHNYTDIYAGRVRADGSLPWGAGGVVVCAGPVLQSNAHVIPDGAGGVIVAWYERATTNWDIRAQRLDANGVRLWTPAHGVAVCTDSNDQHMPVIASDGAGGAIIAWQDERGASPLIYVQRVDASGTATWTTDGFAVNTHYPDQTEPLIVSDDAGGAIVVFNDNYQGDTRNPGTRAHRIDANGAQLWDPRGVAVVPGVVSHYKQAVGDGAGGAILAWSSDDDIKAQRIDAAGVVQWTPGGVDICTTPEDQGGPEIVADGSGGAVIAWEDQRNELTAYNIYAQRVNADGVTQWPTDGVAVVDQPNSQNRVSMTTDGTGGAIFTWRDDRAIQFQYKAYAQRVDGTGAVRWNGAGVEVSPLANRIMYPKAVTDAHGGVIIAWESERGPTTDIYGQRLSDLPISVGDPTIAPRLIVRPNVPNPFSESTTITFSSPVAGPGRLEVFDVRGRQVYNHPVSATQGWQSVRLGGQGLRSGVYFYRVRIAGAVVTKKLVITR